MTNEDLAILNQAHTILNRHRLDIDADGVVVSLGCHAVDMPSVSIESVSVGLKFKEGIFTGSAKYMADACAIARRKHADEIARLEKAKADKRTPAPRTPTNNDGYHSAVAA